MNPTSKIRFPRVTAIPLAVTLGVLASLLLIFCAGVPNAEAKAPKRVVALSPFSANTMALLGTQPVAVGQTLGGDRRLAPSLSLVPRLRLSHPNGPNLEQLSRMRPQLVFNSSEWSKGAPAMERLGARVVQVEPRTVSQVYRQVGRVAANIGRKAEGRKLVTRMRKSVSRSTRGIDKNPRVMLILGVSKTPYTFLPNSWGGEVVKRAGGRLLTGGLSGGGGFARLSDEIVVSQNPSVIIAVPHGNQEDIPAMKEYLRQNPAWSQTDAVENGRIHISTDNSLLQAGTDVGRTIKVVRRYLGNL